MVRLADGDTSPAPDKNRVLEVLMDLMDSEEQIKASLLPNLGLDPHTEGRLAENISTARALLAHWEEMQGTEHWRALESQYFIPRLNAACGQLARILADSQEGLKVLDGHLDKVRAAFALVGDWHAAADVALSARIKAQVAACDADWGRAETLSQTALRALRSTLGFPRCLWACGSRLCAGCFDRVGPAGGAGAPGGVLEKHFAKPGADRGPVDFR